jgi:uncharacterized linocin/CFP29 family protein
MTTARNGGAAVDAAKTLFAGSSGTWAGQMFLAALQRGEEISPAALRTLDTLRKDEWKVFDEALVEEGVIRLRAVADLLGAGLTFNVSNGLGKTVYEYEKMTDMFPAEVSMDGNARTENDRVEFELASLPLPITHKDFFINLRTLSASRERGESLDTTQVRVAGRLIAEATESLLINGSSHVYGGLPIYGYRTFPARNTESFQTTNWDDPAKTGADMLTDIQVCKAALEADRFYGPYWVYVPAAASRTLSNDFKAATDKPVLQRLLEVDGVEAITVCDQMAAQELVMVQGTRDVAMMVQGEPLQTVQWDINGGFTVNFKAFQISVPLLRSDAQGRCGIVHMT